MPTSPAPSIQQRELPGRLLAEGNARRLDHPDWMQGINFNEVCDTVGGLYGCTTSPTEKQSADVGAVVHFEPFLAWHVKECAANSPVDVLEADAQAGYRRLRSRRFAEMLHAGHVDVPNATLQSSAADLTPGGGPATLANTIQGLLDVYHSLGVSEFMIHAPLFTLPEWGKLDLFEWTGARYQLGHIPVAFDAYPNVGPDAAGNDAPADGSGEAWLYITGPVLWQEAQQQLFTSLEQRENIRRSLVEALALIVFDPCSVLAAKARIC